MRSRQFLLPTFLFSLFLLGFCAYLPLRPGQTRARTAEKKPLPGSASISFIQGKVEVQKQEETWQDARLGEVLVPGDAIRTAEGRAELLLWDGRGRFRLDRETGLTLLEGGRWGGRVEQGSVWAEVSPWNDEQGGIVLESSVASGFAEDAVFRIHIPKSDSSVVSVYDGLAKVTFPGNGGAEQGWKGARTVSVGQSLALVPGRDPVVGKIDLRGDWNDGWQREEDPRQQIARSWPEVKAFNRDLREINSEVYLSVDVELRGREAHQVLMDQARIRRFRIRSRTWDHLDAQEKVEVLQETFNLLKREYPNITPLVVLEFDDGRPDLELKYATSLKG